MSQLTSTATTPSINLTNDNVLYVMTIIVTYNALIPHKFFLGI